MQTACSVHVQLAHKVDYEAGREPVRLEVRTMDKGGLGRTEGWTFTVADSNDKPTVGHRRGSVQHVLCVAVCLAGPETLHYSISGWARHVAVSVFACFCLRLVPAGHLHRFPSVIKGRFRCVRAGLTYSQSGACV